jgi:hypothetical protein
MTFEQYSRETQLRLEDAGRLVARLRGSDRPAHATVWRWCKRGLRVKHGQSLLGGDGASRPPCKVVRLEYHRVGGRIMTTEQAVWRFLEATQDRSTNEVAVSQPRSAQLPPESLVVDTAKARVASFLTSKPQTSKKHLGHRGIALPSLANPSGRNTSQRARQTKSR